MKTLLTIIALFIGLSLTAQTNIIYPSGGGPSKGSIPGLGTYVGYVNYTRTNPVWGWTTNASVLSSGSGNTNVFVQYLGKRTDSAAAVGSITWDAFSQKYRFTVYFRTSMPTNYLSYPLQTVGFLP